MLGSKCHVLSTPNAVLSVPCIVFVLDILGGSGPRKLESGTAVINPVIIFNEILKHIFNFVMSGFWKYLKASVLGIFYRKTLPLKMNISSLN